MVRPVVGEGFLSRCTPQGCTAVIGVFQTHYVIYVDKVTRLVGVETNGGIWLIASVVEVFAFVAVCIGCKGLG